MRARRSFLKAASCLGLATPFVARSPWAAETRRAFDPTFGTAHEAARAIQSGAISSRELCELVLIRISRYNSKINAFITVAQEQAMEQAKLADDALAVGKVRGALHGVPIVIKDVFATTGIRTTAGSKLYENHVPREDAVAVGRLKSAGAIVIAKTNVPEFAGDHQSFNQVAGTTNNPWDLARTPGGSTGGGAAALAAGLGFLELGSDLGGSIRNPSHFCGVYGHKPTIELVPRTGIITGPPSSPAFSFNYLPVAGPMARSAQDLKLALEVTGGPAAPESLAYRWTLPAARGTRLKEYRMGYVLTDPFCPPTSEISDLLSNAVDAMRRQRAQIDEGWPPGVQFQTMFEDFYFLFQNTRYQTDEQLRKSIDSLKGRDDYYSVRRREALSASRQQWGVKDAMRLKARALWQEYFRDYDVFLMPVNFAPAFPHDQQTDWDRRSIETPEGKRDFRDIVRWISIPTFTGCPATVAPVGTTKQGLPVGIQIMGPFLEDATPITIAGLMADVVGGFVAPPSFASN